MLLGAEPRALLRLGATHARTPPSPTPCSPSTDFNLSGPAYKYTSASAFTYDGGALDDGGERRAAEGVQVLTSAAAGPQARLQRLCNPYIYRRSTSSLTRPFPTDTTTRLIALCSLSSTPPQSPSPTMQPPRAA